MNIQNFSSIPVEYQNDQLKDFSTRQADEKVISSAPHVNNIDNVSQKDNGDTLSITKESSVAAKRLQAPRDTVSRISYGTNFSTSPDDREINLESDNEQNNSQNNADVLNQYRFFVQSYQYQDADGAVKRIFR